MKLLLVCAGGMSTSMLMKKLVAYADEHGIEFSVDATGSSGLKNANDFDVVLLGPQIAYQQEAIKKRIGEVPIGVIPMRDYGMARCENIFAQIDDLVG
ncbi:phosphotransferase system lactose/cellobiose-specific IIB subunit [Coriobacterium glomerans PW2]|uniref:Phosphotransferase system lactose/cellobiose-specific IIB subunit n=1 Tax=Coriobacterium glomerans (strain ATCC 49209 / DSM 20642 / JCM 10262 / PW2) TaxID=700015 RepID=F2N8U5_CORGP|nr:PTS sugar transporter subunit IIB [Coriobacterium glomerans]AEB07545.1 phosphotransferase system lactose/cellobiose-specific IIB subunit [Coriobacterium glomerans PW2]